MFFDRYIHFHMYESDVESRTTYLKDKIIYQSCYMILIIVIYTYNLTFESFDCPK